MLKSHVKLVFPILAIAGLINVLGVGFSKAQQIQGRAVYIRDNTDNTESLISLESGILLTLPKSNCIFPSPDLHYAAFLDRDQLTVLSIYDLTSRSLVREIPWQADWTWPCAVDWLDNRTVTIITAWDNQQYYEIEVVTGAITGPAPGSGPHYLLPNQDPESTIVVASPNHRDTVYRYCFGTLIQGEVRERCDGNSSFVIYDLQSQQIAIELEHYSAPTEIHPVPPDMYFSWSPSGRYLTHLSTRQLVEIFDRSTNSYLDLSFIPQEMYTIYQNELYSWSWSPDETQVAFWVNGLSRLGYGTTDRGIIAVDFVNRRVRLIPVPYPEINELRTRDVDWAWNLNGDGFLVLTRDLQLNQIAFDGTISYIAEHVDSLFVDHSGSITILTGQITLPGRPAAPNARLVVPLRVKLVQGGSVTNTYDPLTTDPNARFTINDIPQGAYDVWLKNPQALAVMPTVNLNASLVSADFGTMRMGDANDSNSVTTIDFSILAATYGKVLGNPGYDPRADFDGSSSVTITDYALLASNMGQAGVPEPGGVRCVPPKFRSRVLLAFNCASRGVGCGSTASST